MEDCSSSVAQLKSLLKWVNTFDEIHCTSFSDLSSGVGLLKCMQSFTPDVQGNLTEDPWQDLFGILEDFCGCSLERALSREKILAGDEEHIARVVVLLLCVAVQSKENEKIVGAIMSMDMDTQRDIMFYIESTLAQVKSHALVAGTFTSGVGEQLPSLEDKSASASPCPAALREELVSSPFQPLARAPSDEVHPFPTPHRPSRTLHSSNFYNGLESSAGARLLMSPAIPKLRSKIRKSNLPSSLQGPLVFDSQEQEELSLLRHNVRVLKGSLEVETKLARDYYNEVCAKIEEHEQLKKNYFQLESKLGCLQELEDLKDELAHTSVDLASAQKALVSYMDRAASAERYKEKVADLEEKLKDYEQISMQLDDAKLCSQKMETSLMEKVAALKHTELSLSKVTIELEAKSSHLESLLQENREHKRELLERERKCASLETTVSQLEGRLENKEDTERTMNEQNKELSAQIESLQGSLRLIQADVSSLTAEKQVTKVHVASLQEEINQLRTELDSKIMELTSKDFRVQSVESNVMVLDDQLVELQVRAKELEKDLQQKEKEISRYNTNLAAVISEKTQLEEDVRKLDQQVSASEESTSKFKEMILVKDKNLASITLQCSEQEVKLNHLAELESSNDRLIVAAEESKEKLQQLEIKSKESISTLQDQVCKKTKSLVEIEQEKSTLSQQIVLLQSKFNQDYGTLRGEHSSLEKAVVGKDTTISSLQEERSVLRNKIDEEKLANEELAIKLDAILTKNESCLKKLNEECGKVGLIQKENATKDEVIKDLQVTNQAITAENTDLKEVADRLRAEQTATSKELESLLAEKNSLNEVIRELQSEVRAADSLKADCLSKDIAIRTSQETCQALKIESSGLRERIDLIHTEMTNKFATLLKERDVLSTERDFLNKAVEELRSEVSTAQRQLICSHEVEQHGHSTKEVTPVACNCRAILKAMKEELLLQMGHPAHPKTYQPHKGDEEARKELEKSNASLDYGGNCPEKNSEALTYMQLLHSSANLKTDSNDDLRDEEGSTEEVTPVACNCRAILKAMKEELLLQMGHPAHPKTYQPHKGDEEARKELEKSNASLDYGGNCPEKNSEALTYMQLLHSSANLKTDSNDDLRDEEGSTEEVTPVACNCRAILKAMKEELLLQMGHPAHPKTYQPHKGDEEARKELEKSNASLDYGGNCPEKNSEALTCMQLLHSSANLKTDSNDDLRDEEGRINELKRRNRRVMPHLKSSYPVEMQVQSESVLTSDSILKNLDSHINCSLGTSSSEECSAPPSARSEQHSSRKRNLDETWQPSDVSLPSENTGTASVLPEPALDSYRYREFSADKTSHDKLQLRNYLDLPQSQPHSSGTSFDIVISPAKSKSGGLPPKRLRERRQRSCKADKSGTLVPSSSGSTSIVSPRAIKSSRTSSRTRIVKQKPKK